MMALTIQAPEIERELREKAAQHGMDAEAFLLELVVGQLSGQNGGEENSPVHPLYETAGPEELKAALQNWAQSHSASTPPIPDEALRRENLYDDRGL